MSLFDNPDECREKLKESLVITTGLLDFHSKVYTETHECNEKLQVILEQTSLNGQAGLALFENIASALSAEQNAKLLEYATAQVNLNQQLFEMLKTYKGLEKLIDDHIAVISPQIAAFAKP